MKLNPFKHPEPLQKIIDAIVAERQGKNWSTTDRLISEAILKYYREGQTK